MSIDKRGHSIKINDETYQKLIKHCREKCLIMSKFIEKSIINEIGYSEMIEPQGGRTIRRMRR
jgi:hypothetical protein